MIESSLIDPLLSNYKEKPTINEATTRPKFEIIEDENESDVQSSLFDNDEHLPSPQSCHSLATSHSSLKSTNNNPNQYTFEPDVEMDENDDAVFDYENMGQSSTSSTKNGNSTSFPYSEHLESKVSQFVKPTQDHSNSIFNQAVNLSSDLNNWCSNTFKNDDTMDGITMLNPSLVNSLHPNWNFDSFVNATENHSHGSLFNRKIESLFGNNSAALHSRNEASGMYKLQPTSNTGSISGSNKALGNVSEDGFGSSVEPKPPKKTSKSDDFFSVHLSQYNSKNKMEESTSINPDKDLFSSFDFYNVLPNSKSTNAILDFFAGANGSYNGSGNDIFDPEILKASS